VRWRPLLLGILAVAGLYAVLGLLIVVLARYEISNGLQKLHDAEVALQRVQQRGVSPSVALRTIQGQLTGANADFHNANMQVQPFAVILRGLFWLPVVGQKLSAAPDAARLADDITAGGVLMLSGLTPAIDRLSHRHRAGITSVLASLEQSSSTFSESSDRLFQAQRDRASLSSSARIALSAQLPSVDRDLPRLLALSRVLHVLPDIVGFKTSRSYLMAYQNPHELRATGGFIGSVAIEHVRKGHISNDFTSTLLKDNLSVPPPDPISIYSDEPGWLLRDSNWSPDFPTSAALERFFLRLDLHRDVNGVINLTPQAAAYVLQGTGPLYVPEYRRWVNSHNVAALADFYSHWTNGWGGPHAYTNLDTRRKQFMPIVGRHILAALNTLPLQSWIRLGQSLSNAIARRDILLNFRSPTEQSVIQSLGAGGEINRTTSDYLYVVDTNIGWSKINQFVHLSTTYRATIRPDNWLDSQLTMHFTNVPAPASDRAQGWQGPGLGRLGSWDDYGTFLRIYVPAGAELIHQSGWYQPWSPGPAYGKTMFSGYVIARAGRSVTVRLRYLLPPNVFTWSGGKRYRLVVQHQPGDYPKRWSMSVRQSNGRSRSWTVSHPTVDWVGSFAIKPHPVHPIPLPYQEPPLVIPGHWIEPHTFLASHHA
jgi:Protein of unknown function (DUF4012)